MKNNLKAIRKRLKLNQDEFAEIIKKSRVHLSRMENSPHPPNPKTVQEIVQCLNNHFGDTKINAQDFYEFNEDVGNVTSQEKSLLTLVRMMTDKDQDRFISMAEAFVHQPKEEKKS